MKFMLHCRKFCPEIRVIKVPKTAPKKPQALALPGPPAHQHTSTPAKRINAPVARTGIPGQAGLKNVEGKARRHRQYASTARSCNAAIGIFSGPRFRPAVVKPCAFKRMALLNLKGLAPKPPLCAARLYNLSFPSHTASLPCQHN